VAAFQGIHDIYNVLARWRGWRIFSRHLSPLLPKLFYEHSAIAVFQTGGIKVFRLYLQNMLAELHHFSRQCHIRNVRRILCLAADLVLRFGRQQVTAKIRAPRWIASLRTQSLARAPDVALLTCARLEAKIDSVDMRGRSAEN
jgi:hypothetical protein